MMHEMKENGQTLLVSTHIIDSMDQLWDKAIILQKGRVKGDVTRKELERLGRSLEEEFFALTEGLSGEDMSDSSSSGEEAK